MAARALILAAALAAVLGPAAVPVPAQPAVELRKTPGQPAEVRICGIQSELAGDGFDVRAVEAGAAADAATFANLPPLWGEYTVERRCTVFRPRHQPAPGMELVVYYRGQILARLAMPPAVPSAKVEEIYPSGSEIPENLLRFYVAFTGPMSIKGIEQHLHLRNARGEEIPAAFAPVPDGLWDPDQRRLTIFLHPGRVKSGIAVGEQLGPVLRAGEEVSLEVDQSARDADGAPLLAGGRRSWKIGPPQKAPLAAGSFRLAVQDDTLEIAAGVALDRALALGAFTVLREGRESVGEWTLEPGERRLRFAPLDPWQPGETYVLRIGEQLEDVAGNRLGRAFEVEGGEDAAVRDAAVKAAEIPFRP